jgi:signal transduction histidine kinase
MTGNDAATLLARLPAALDAVLDQPRDDLDGRAGLVSEVLAALRPAGPFYACLLRGGGREAVSIRGTSSSPALVDGLRRAADQGQAGAAGLAAVVVPVAWRERRFGAVALPVGLENAALLTAVADRLALLLALEDAGGAGPRLGGSAYLANLVEMTSVLTHEFNNFLNGILLHLALLEQNLPPEAAPQLTPVRKLGNNAAALVKRYQQYSRTDRPPASPTDLNAAVKAAADQAKARGPGVGVRLELDPVLPPVAAVPGELERLVGLLVGNAVAAAAAGGGTVTVRTEKAEDRLLLHVEDDGPAIPADLLNRLFEPFVLPRAGVEEPGLAVTKVLARRLHGSVHGENRPGGGVAFVLDIPLDAAS